MTDRTPAERFAELVEDAFGALPIPPRSALVAEDARRFEDTLDMVREFAGQHWRDLAPARLHYHRDGLRGLSPTGFQFYLPAYLRAAFPDPTSPWYATGDVQEWTLWALAPRRPTEEDRAAFQRQIALLTEPQREVVRAYLCQEMAVDPTSSSLLGVRRRGGWGV